jgi:hypothetical protein
MTLCRRNHCPGSRIAAHFLKIVHDVEAHGREAIEVAIPIHLYMCQLPISIVLDLRALT